MGEKEKAIFAAPARSMNNSLTIIIKDRGKSFDPSIIPPPKLSDNLSEREAHGLGLYFIRQWMDEVHFTTNGSENVLTLMKRR